MSYYLFVHLIYENKFSKTNYIRFYLKNDL